MRYRYRVHDVIEALKPEIDYATNRTLFTSVRGANEKVNQYWYVITKNDRKHIYVDSYFLTADGCVFGDVRGLKCSIENFDDIISKYPYRYKYKETIAK